MKILEFFQGEDGMLSAKRLGYLSTVPVSSFGTFWLCNKLAENGNAELSVQLWTSYLIFSAVLGGFVSAELIPTILLAIRGVTLNKDKKDDEKTIN